MIKPGLISKRNIFSWILFLLFASSALAQPKGQFAAFQRNNIFLETNFVPSDTGYACFISYRISFDNLIFVKNDHKFNAGITLDFELLNDSKIVERKTSSKSISVDSYDSTISQKDFLQGVLRLDIGRKNYVLNSFVSIANGDRNLHLDSIKINQAEIIKHSVLRPIAVIKDGTDCGTEFPFQLVNFENTIPFSPSSAELLIPVADTSVSKIIVSVTQDKKAVFTKAISDYVTNKFGFLDCNDKIYFQKSDGNKALKYFYVPDVNGELKEGPADVEVKTDSSKMASFIIHVFWNDKPRSLMMPEMAIQCLAAIEKPEVIDSLLSLDKDEYAKALSEYWNGKFPEKKHVFNEYEFEYYQRVDYALKKFGSVVNKNGAKSDRGMIYIRYGQPDEIKRDYNNSNMAIEIWTYKRLNKEFLFTDKTGLGNYTLGQ